MVSKSEIEINLLEFGKKVLLHWKTIILAMLFIGMAVSGLKYFKDSTNAANARNKTDEEIDEISLGIYEKDAADTIADRILRAAVMEDYANNAIKMQIDPLHCKTLECVYKIQIDDAEDVEVIKALLEQFICSDSFTKSVAEAMRLDSAENYVDELIEGKCENTVLLASDNEGLGHSVVSCALELSVLLPAFADDDKVTESVDKSISEYVKEISATTSGFSINCVSSKVSKETNRLIQTEKYSFYNIIVSEKNGIKSMMSTFSGNQEKYLVKRLLESGMDKDNMAKYINEDVIDSALADSESDLSSANVEFSIVYFAIGSLAALFCYVLILFCVYFFTLKAGRLFGYGMAGIKKELGIIKGIDAKKNTLWNKLYKVDGTAEEQASAIISSIIFRLNDKEEKGMTFISFGEISKEIQLLKDSWKKQIGSDCKAIELHLDKTDQTLLYKELEEIDSCVVAVIKKDGVQLRDVDRVMGLIGEKKIDLLGSIEVL